MTKMDMVKQNVQMYINIRTEEIEKLQKDIKDCANQYGALDMITFLPNKIKDLEKAMVQLKMYQEQMKALEFLEKED